VKSIDPVPAVPDAAAEAILQPEDEAAELLFLLQDRDWHRRKVDARL
jgi:hypothetical protein